MTTVMVSPCSCLMALVTSSLVSSTAMDSSTGTSQAWMVALTWPRATPTDAGSAASVFICFLTRLCEPAAQSASHSARASPGGRSQPIETLDLAVATQMLVQVAVRDIGQVTDI